MSQQQSSSNFEQNQQSNNELEDDSGISFSSQSQSQQGQSQLAKDAEKYEQELNYVAQKGGHKGIITEKDAEIVQQQNETKPWYQRLRVWSGQKFQQLADTFRGKSESKRESYYY